MTTVLVCGSVAGPSHLATRLKWRVEKVMKATDIVAGRFTEDEPEPFDCTWREYCDANADGLDDLAEVESALDSVGIYYGGGGAAPMYSLTRLDRRVEQ